MAARFIRLIEVLPPLDNLDRHFTVLAPEQHEVVGRAVLRMVHLSERHLAEAALEPVLQHPDHLDIGHVTALNHELFALCLQHHIACLVERLGAALALLLEGLPAAQRLGPEERGKKERGRGLLPRVDPLIRTLEREHHEFFARGLRIHHVEHRQKPVMQPFLPERLNAGHGVAAREELDDFVKKTRVRHILQEIGHLRNRTAGRLIDPETELRGDADRAHHADWILAVALLRVPDDPQALVLQILVAVVIVEHFLRRRIVVEGVDREVTARRVFPHFAEDVVGNHAARGVLSHAFGIQRTERGALNHFTSENHVHQTETPADDDGALLAGLHLFRRRVRRDVKILRLDAKQHVAHGAAHHISLEAAALKRFTGPDRLPGDELRPDPMH